ncbi:MAG: hypothetical protein ABIO87_04075 [Chthoniobacterales bacterium]
MVALLAGVLFLTETAQGRIGERESQIQARFGNPVTVLATAAGESGVTKCYGSDNFSIAITFLHGKSVREIVTKKDNSKITEAEINALLEANAGDSSWNEQGVGPENNVTSGVQKWRSADRRARIAFYDSQTHAFFITTQRFIDLTNAKLLQDKGKTKMGGIVERGGVQRTYDTLGKRGSQQSLPTQPAGSPAK